MNEYSKVNWQDGTVLQPAKVTIDGVDHEVTPAVESGTTPVNATNLDKMDTALKQAHDGVRSLDANKIDKSTIELLTVDSVAPENCSEGDLYYNTTTNLIYTATATDTWSETGELPTSKYLYVDLSNSKLYYYDGNNFTSYGGGNSNDVVISDEEPETDDWKLWIDSDEVGSQVSEITNEYSTSTGLGYSANYVNNINTYSTTDEIRVGTWIDGKPLYRKVLSVPTLPNNSEITITIDSTFIVKKFEVYTKKPTQNDSITFRLPVVGTNYINAFIFNDKITIQTTSNRTAFTENYAIIEYTKTTD